jgi:hypothetical protein
MRCALTVLASNVRFIKFQLRRGRFHVSITYVHAMWTSSLPAGMKFQTAAATKTAPDANAPAKAFSRAIPTPRIPLHT